MSISISRYYNFAIYYIAISLYNINIWRYRDIAILYRDIDQSLIQSYACMHAYIFTCRQMTLTKKIVSRIRDSRAGSPYRRKLRYPKFNFILFPLLPIFSIIWVSIFCVCHSKFDWNQFFTKNFIIWQRGNLCKVRPFCTEM